MKKKLTKIGIVIMSSFILMVISFIALFIYFSVVPVKVNDINKYLETDGLKSSYVFFPESIDDDYDVIEYHYYDYRLINGSEIILSIKYDDVLFVEEFDRLNSLKHSVNDHEPKALVKDENKKLFNYYTFVAEYQPQYKQFEYACFDFDNKIVHYIRLDYIDIEYIGIDHSLLPKFYLDNDEFYSQYYFNIYSGKLEYNWL